MIPIYEQIVEQVKALIRNGKLKEKIDIKAGKKPQIDKFFEVKQMLQDGGAEVVLLGCTELSIIKRDCDTGRGVLDVMEVLAQQSVIECGKLKPEYNNLITE